ncbi:MULTISPECIES: DUF2569 family protein [unclassified Acinetobacter]|uniref:DUF2569 family protein n=1 Tax=unclassified Acinetobacter TaxID=196816 RepID=UPI0015D3AA6A
MIKILKIIRSATDTQTLIQLATSNIGCLIWTSYLLMSVRVKNTFTQHSKHSA